MIRRTAAKKSTSKTTTPTPGRLRIVAGIWRSRILEVADVPGLRPTSERIRETLFNWLSPEIIGKRCLDLYAGTGALGLEALSRGAKSAEFVETNAQAAKILQANIASLGATAATLHRMDAKAYLDSSAGSAFDIVFLDPPFANDNIEELCRLLADNNLLTANAQIYVEQDNRQALPELPRGWSVTKQKNAGNVRYALISIDNALANR